ncbi:MFS transporter [Flavihumibacter rivuli]|uniref:MFS transporter n=1 Tax=Flavihumibacter rivuli TaxID=2838156 RepID=UPI001BDE9CF9|nr:MFS transporter [Flavihumibacter rivuli]ULQ55411.1 MFS transporter [Flavihumibacter rivuli]
MKTDLQQGLGQNWKQFSLLVLVNAFVGAMVGLERAVMPGFAEHIFGKQGQVVLLSFIMAFGTSKALANLMMGMLSERFTRKHLLLLGWIAAIPVPFLLMYAEHWGLVILANIFLGLNQGLAWSSTVVMKIDLVGEKNRGLAMGINEFAGYAAVGLAAYLATSLASNYGFRAAPFVPGILFSIAGLLVSWIWVKDTHHHVQKETQLSKRPLLDNVWKATSYQHPTIGTVTINGLMNNLNDGVIWGLLPVLLATKGYSLTETGVLAGLYPAIWGFGQLFTGRMGDTHCKKQLITTGMLLQALALAMLVFTSQYYLLAVSMVLMGIGTALVYPNFLSSIAEQMHPQQRAKALGIFRFWRDSGYVIGALMAALLTSFFGLSATLLLVAFLTAGAGLMAHSRMCCTNKQFWGDTTCLEVY